MKFVTLIIICLILLYSTLTANAEEVLVHADWAFNSSTPVNGFKIYIQHPDSEVWDLIGTAENNDSRTWEGLTNISEGRSKFVMTAYTDSEESVHSPEFPFEYLVTRPDPGVPPPSVRFSFNLDVEVGGETVSITEEGISP